MLDIESQLLGESMAQPISITNTFERISKVYTNCIYLILDLLMKYASLDMELPLFMPMLWKLFSVRKGNKHK